LGVEWHSTKHKGVRYRVHKTRKHGINYDRYFAIRYQKDGKRKEEGLGWLSEGWTLDDAVLKLTGLKKDIQRVVQLVFQSSVSKSKSKRPMMRQKKSS